jgi:putative sterol carrier protein
MARITPPEDISPQEFFTRWLPAMVREDDGRRRRLGNTEASIVFAFTEVEHGAYTIHIRGGEVRGEASHIENPDLVVRVDVETWRRLNRGDLSAPEAALRRRVKLEGDLLLALKLHLILG